MSDQVLDDFNVGEVISQSFNSLFRNFIPFTSIGVLLYVPVFLLLFYYQDTPLQTGDPFADAEALMQGMYVSFGGMMLAMIATFMVYGAVTFGTVRDLQGQPARFGEILSRGFATFFPVFGVAIVSGLAIWLGFFLFVIPAFIVLTMLYVAVPVTVIERPGILDSLSRSAELTKGLRWKILGVWLLTFLIGIILSLVIGIFTFAGPVIAGIVDIALTGVSYAFGAVAVAVTYQELRRVKEGVGIDSIASVFS